MRERICCTPKFLPRDKWIDAARCASAINPVNQPPIVRLAHALPDFQPTPERIAVLTTKYWHTKGVRLAVGFLDDPSSDLRNRILLHMNAWAKTANVKFVEAKTDPQVRIARTPGDGHWSYLGTDILSVDSDQPTMNLDSFTMATEDSEYHRVVRHETGHTLGFPHEHMRKELVERIDPRKAIAYFTATQGWTPAEVRAQVLTPIDQASLMGTQSPDEHSIMCYQIPGSLTKDGQPIIGGVDIDDTDYAFAATAYPQTLE
jgi:hypothetical protein